jgi:hypothetical protein
MGYSGFLLIDSILDPFNVIQFFVFHSDPPGLPGSARRGCGLDHAFFVHCPQRRMDSIDR